MPRATVVTVLELTSQLLPVFAKLYTDLREAHGGDASGYPSVEDLLAASDEALTKTVKAAEARIKELEN
mgnify:CR=1 FL=1